MKTMKNETLWPHPGEILRECMNDLGITAMRLSRATRIPASRITEILKGRRSISVDTALRLGKALGTTPNYWLNLQQSYDLRRANSEPLNEVDVLVVCEEAPESSEARYDGTGTKVVRIKY